MVRDFDPWTADFEDAQAAQAEFAKTRIYGQKWHDPRQPIFQWDGAQYVQHVISFHQRFESVADELPHTI